MTSHSIFVTRCPRFYRFPEMVEHEVIKILLEVIRLAYACRHSKLPCIRSPVTNSAEGLKYASDRRCFQIFY
ncbi:MAG: hypothetical protein K0R28_2540 [Paenibacillus sp.]|jgi:hypothetical protein|nr:hypothetical protein [Paenibacillus sp.]